MICLPRLSIWIIVTGLLLLAIGWLSPVQLPVVLYKLGLVTLGGVLGYWLDRGLFPYARPHQLLDDDPDGPGHLSMIRRALIVLACILGLTLGL
ncbi:hypothetical protein AN401_07165 [Zobellella denitrificans]|uniref:2/3 transmembrane domain holin n=1 Tax=Zobellella denitrificans TaxID=347534 RepID=A0A291HNE4_9GAMM|nr:putative holin [Zobellella denitrificans]ATG73663.1 hypothetical protein AN401_07165 [Zobellella denitrificans]